MVIVYRAGYIDLMKYMASKDISGRYVVKRHMSRNRWSASRIIDWTMCRRCSVKFCDKRECIRGGQYVE